MHPTPRFFFLALMLTLFAGCNGHGSSSDGGGKTLGPAPAWSLKDLDGKPVSLSDFKGKVVILDVWATWCPPCRAEIPHFIEIQNEWKDKGVTVVGMSVDSTGPADVAKFVKDNGMNYPIVMADEDAATAYGADQGIPLTVVIDKQGQVVARHLGLTDKAIFEADIQKALAD